MQIRAMISAPAPVRRALGLRYPGACALARASSNRPIEPIAMATFPWAFIAGTPLAGEWESAAS